MWDRPRLAVFQTWVPMPFAPRDFDLCRGCPHFHFEYIPLIDLHFSGFLEDVCAVTAPTPQFRRLFQSALHRIVMMRGLKSRSVGGCAVVSLQPSAVRVQPQTVGYRALLLYY